jgi:hypothetical protein
MQLLRMLVGCGLAATLSAQAVTLPHGTGTLTPPPGWTTLATAELAAATRPSDPSAEPARTQLLGLIGELQRHGRTAEHVVLYTMGAVPGALRSVDAYSDGVPATRADLLDPATIARVRDAYQAELRKSGATVTFLGHDDPQLFPSGSLRLRFELDQQGLRTLVQHHTVPAGERVQYFETACDGRDADAPGALDAVLRTFDGAREAPAGMLTNMLLGGMCGGLAGVLMAVWRKRRLQRLANGGAVAR